MQMAYALDSCVLFLLVIWRMFNQALVCLQAKGMILSLARHLEGPMMRSLSTGLVKANHSSSSVTLVEHLQSFHIHHQQKQTSSFEEKCVAVDWDEKKKTMLKTDELRVLIDVANSGLA